MARVTPPAIEIAFWTMIGCCVVGAPIMGIHILRAINERNKEKDDEILSR